MSWNLLAFLVLTAGHTELQVTLVNRLHAGRISRGSLRWIRHIHDALIPLFPLILVWFLGFRGPGLLVGGEWVDVPTPWLIVCGLCGMGFAGLLFSSGRWLSKPVPMVQLSNHSRVVDIAEKLGGPPVGDGPLRWMTRFPGNEIFQLEVGEQELHLPRLPAEWDGLSILHLSDLHFTGTTDRAFFEEVTRLAQEMPSDLIVFTGDLLDRQSLVEWLPSTLGKLRARLGCYFILGNHDWFLDPAEIRTAMTDLNWIDVAGRMVKIAPSENSQRKLSIGGSELPWMGTQPDFSQAGNDDFRLLLSHSPDNLPWAKTNGVDLVLSGHNHGGQVVLPVIGPVYSPSRFGTRYASGAFWESPTLLYVTRGISSQHPLRLGCRPELTKIVLRSDPSAHGV